MNHCYTTRIAALLLNFCMIAAFLISPCNAQRQIIPGEMTNGDFENYENEKPVDWTYVELRAKGVKFEPDTKNPFTGETCMFIDASESEESFVTFNHPVKPDEFAGKRIRFQAALRVEDGEAGSNVGLWLRADLVKDNGGQKIVAFENMQSRPVTDSQWQYYSIVIDIPDEVDALFAGLIVGGKVKVWIDDASLEIVDDDVELTGTSGSGDDGPDALFTWWLVLPGIAISLFAISHCGSNLVQRFALRFSVVYWLLYYLPEPFISLGLEYKWMVKFQEFVSGIVNWFGITALNIDVEWAFNGSGDTSYDFARILTFFIVSLFAALVWSFLDWRKTDSSWMKDVLRSFLRYSLAFAMVSYGLGKLVSEMNQFSVPGPEALDQTYGESSPMGLLWTFMGASQPYTNFAGLGEFIAALLLVWRRTTILGAFVAIGVMTNVVMLNFCYDVPVKLYSTHLLVTAMFILLPEVKRLANLFLLNRSSEPADFRPPYTGPITIWIQRLFKGALIVMGIGMPFYEFVKTEMAPRESEPSYYGVYLVQEFQIGDAQPEETKGENEPADDDDATELEVPDDESSENEEAAAEDIEEDAVDATWKSVTFRRFPFSQEEGEQFTDVIMIRAVDKSRLGGPFKTDEDELKIVVSMPSETVPGKLSIKVIDEEHLEVRGETSDERPLVVKLKRNDEESLLMSRGFHWINENPFNR